jgi:hypothetical protein
VLPGREGNIRTFVLKAEISTCIPKVDRPVVGEFIRSNRFKKQRS